jgi:mannose-1-phosphate guanylyltransferase
VKALLLTGGFGTRLRPLTYTRPKHLLPIANRPHMEHVFALLARHGIDDVVITTSYLAEAFRATIEAARARGVVLEVAHEPEPLGTAGAIRNAEAQLAGETFVVFNGDILTDADLSEMIDFHRARDAEATILLTPVEDPSAYGVVPTNPDGKVLRFIEKPSPQEAPTNLINAGVYLFEPSVLRRVPPGQQWSAETQLFPDLVAEGAGLFAFATAAYWMDIGTPQKYLQANLDALSGRFGGNGVGGDMVLADLGSVVVEGARVRRACLGAGARVEGGARVEESVLLPGAVVGADATVVRSILGEGALVAPRASLVGEAVADNQAIHKE